jgi:hypothetical protein
MHLQLLLCFWLQLHLLLAVAAQLQSQQKLLCWHAMAALVPVMTAPPRLDGPEQGST